MITKLQDWCSPQETLLNWVPSVVASILSPFNFSLLHVIHCLTSLMLFSTLPVNNQKSHGCVEFLSWVSSADLWKPHMCLHITYGLRVQGKQNRMKHWSLGDAILEQKRFGLKAIYDHRLKSSPDIRIKPFDRHATNIKSCFQTA